MKKIKLYTAVDGVMLEEENKFKQSLNFDVCTIHLGNYDMFVYVCVKDILNDKIYLTFHAPENDIKHIVGSCGSNIDTIKQNINLVRLELGFKPLNLNKIHIKIKPSYINVNTYNKHGKFYYTYEFLLENKKEFATIKLNNGNDLKMDYKYLFTKDEEILLIDDIIDNPDLIDTYFNEIISIKYKNTDKDLMVKE